ncbi:WAT1-related protein At5g07050-like isoform X1 [Benincasa hispida]|uniref:WAT1-related protein At5g07050-like isoform X1 n=1 Tax=Benincasa hispida TaxID=102211 RepID=UPI001902AC9B|nr:WAT1-related protein At5g07050-like isoform X1 [Benincasa hispida]
MAFLEGLGHFFQNAMPYIAVISLQFGYAGMNIISAISLDRGMSHYVLVVYRHAFATAVMAPFALVLERKVRPKITFKIFIQMLVLALLGPLLDQNLYYMGLQMTSPTISCAIGNMLPSMTFAMAVLCKMEKLELKRVRSRAKLFGTLVTLGGAMLMTFYKGSVINFFGTKHGHQPSIPSTALLNHHNGGEFIRGSILLIISTVAWAAFFILQVITLRKYTAHLSLTTMVCFLGTLQAIVVTLAMERRPSAWTIGWDMNLLAAAYAGIVTSGVAYYVQGLVMKTKGPVFVTAFGPMVIVIVAFMGHFILAEKIYVGGIIGSVVIVIGLYSVLWGKYEESKEKEVIGEIVELPMEGEDQLPIRNEAIEAIQKKEASRQSAKSRI